MTRVADVIEHIQMALGRPLDPSGIEPAGGGCINEAVVVKTAKERYFVKLNSADRADMFTAEAQGLGEIASTQTIRVPQVICHGSNGQAFLVLEYLKLRASGSASQDRLGHRLALMHRHTRPRFGWWRDNTIGTTLQPNTEHGDWVQFWRACRLNHQLALAQRNGYGDTLVARGAMLAERLDDFFSDYRPVASLVHGDLWSGNHAALSDGEPVIFDPAVYYGDRETDIAMTELFGRFSAGFYAAYNEAWPLDAGYAVRKALYNLYHVLNHLNLFGGVYLAQANHMIDRLLSEVR